MFGRIAALVAALLALAAAAHASEPLCVVSPQVTALVDTAGEALLEGEAIEDIFPVRPGELYAAGRRGDYGLYDAAGNRLGEARFSMIDDQGDCLVFRTGGLYGAMDAVGRVTLEPVWTQLTSDGAGGFLALDGDPLDDSPDELIHIDAGGGEARTGVYTACALSRVLCGRMPFMDSGGRYGAVDSSGRVAVPARWHYVGGFENGVAKAAGPDGMGLIDVSGAEVLPSVYRWLERGPDMLAASSGDGVEAFAPDGSERLFRVEGEDLEAALVGNCLAVYGGDFARLYDASGGVVVEADAGVTFARGAGGQIIASDGAWGEACQWLVKPDGGAASGRFQCLLPLCEGRYAWLEMPGTEYYSDDLGRLQKSWDYESARWGLADGAGTVLLPAIYTEIRALGGDRLLLIGDGATWLADLDGAVVRSWLTVEA